MSILAILIWALLLGCAAPLTWLWRTTGGSRLRRIGAILLWASFTWLLVSTAYSPALGPNYSDTRLTLINANILAVVIDGIVLALLSGSKMASLISAGWLAFGWLYLRAVSFSL